MTLFWWKHLKEAKEGRADAERQLREAQANRAYVQDLAKRDRESVRRNHFGEAIEIAMGIRRPS